jgi:hypothetical protein
VIALDFEEYLVLMKEMLDQAAAILEHQQVIANIKEELNRNLENPLEQDYIYKDHYGSFPGEPIEREINGVKVITRVLHQTGKGLKDIVGADLLYEIENEKYALIQYKRGFNKKVKGDVSQLDQLLKQCPSVCFYKKKPPSFVPVRMNGFCGCYYKVIDNKNYIVHACEAKFIFSNQTTVSIDQFKSGLSEQVFNELFASCRIGALTNVKKSSYYIQESLNQNKFVLHVLQKGRFGSK